MDEIMDIIEQEKLAIEGKGGLDEEDDKNIDEIWAFIDKQPPSSTSTTSTTSTNGNAADQQDNFLPEELEAEFEAMLQQQQQQYHHHTNSFHTYPTPHLRHHSHAFSPHRIHTTTTRSTRSTSSLRND